jgi:hypothetical protein
VERTSDRADARATLRAPDETITFLSSDIHTAVETALGAARGKNVVIIGADVARQCIEAGLVDEILVHLAPVLLGNGVRLFARDGAPAPVELETLNVTRVGQMTTLRFRVGVNTSDFWDGNPSAGTNKGSRSSDMEAPIYRYRVIAAVDCLRHVCSLASPRWRGRPARPSPSSRVPRRS